MTYLTIWMVLTKKTPWWIKQKILWILEAVTFNIWEGIEANELEDQIDADIKMELEPPAITKATEEDSQVLKRIDLAEEKKRRVRRLSQSKVWQARNDIANELLKLKRDKHLNYLGATKNQASTPTKNSRGSKRCGAQPSTLNQPTKDKTKKRKKKKRTAPPAKITTPALAANPTNLNKEKKKAKRAKSKSKLKKAVKYSQGWVQQKREKKRHRKALRAQVSFDTRHLTCTDHKVCAHMDRLRE